MNVSIRLPQTGKRAKLESVIHLAEAADKTGFDSLWVLERLLWPISPQTRYPSTQTGNFPQDWQNVLESVWTEEAIEFNGQFYTIPPSKIGPRPIQKPHLPIYLSGSSPNTFSRKAKYSNGWIGVAHNNLDQLQVTLDVLKRKVVEATRNPDDFEIVVIIYPNVSEVRTEEAKHLAFTGAIEQ